MPLLGSLKCGLFSRPSVCTCVRVYHFHMSGLCVFLSDLLWRRKRREPDNNPLMLNFSLLSTREWTIFTTATLAATEISSHLIVWWTVDLFWKSRIMVWPASAHPTKTMTRTHSMQVGLFPVTKSSVVFCAISEHFWLFLLFQRSFGRLLSCSYTTAILPKGLRRVMCTVLASYCRK